MTFANAIKVFLFIPLALTVLSACGEKSADAGNSKGGGPALAAFTVYKDPNCGCCSLWIKHMESAGFQLEGKNVDDVSPVKREFGIGLSHRSCHTAVWDDGEARYVFEGHVPAPLVQRFLNERPENGLGLLVPGMPVGSPGMEHGDMRMPYDVLLLRKDGSTEVYAHIAGNGEHEAPR
ncbi:MAG TPA: DUF411 domain-containing protein [Gammaproteobacteria bacterium]|jgi:hypothetical protein